MLACEITQMVLACTGQSASIALAIPWPLHISPSSLNFLTYLKGFIHHVTQDTHIIVLKLNDPS